MKIFLKITLLIILIILFFLVFLFLCFFAGKAPDAEEIKWGVNFSQKHAHYLGLDWKETYWALLSDLGVKRLKILTHWDLLEPEEGKYNFEDLDWQMKKAEEMGAKVLLVIGMKTGRWPECHVPKWAMGFSKEKQQAEVLGLINRIVSRYKNNRALEMWQVENEPFFSFGECPWRDKEFLKKEIAEVRKQDPLREIVVSDSGEYSLWFAPAALGDLVGITMYKTVWANEISNYIRYPFSPVFYWRKAQIIKTLFHKKVICVELQAEPWGPVLLYDLPVKEQKKTMNPEQFKHNIEFAKRTGLDTFYLWGGEWWYWLKTKEKDPRIWQEAKELFSPSNN